MTSCERHKRERRLTRRRRRSKPRSAAGILLLIAAGLIAAGIARGDAEVLFHRATFICMECVGIG